MIRTKFVLAALLCVAFSVSGETQTGLTWTHILVPTIFPSIFGYAYGVEKSRDDGFIVTGNLMHCDGCGGVHGLVLKLRHDGIIQWKNTSLPAFPGRYLPIGSVFQTRDGGYAGLTNRGVVRLGPSGVLKWYKVLVGVYPGTFHETIDGGFVVWAGVYNQPGNLIRLDQSGNVLWSRVYELSACPGQYGLFPQHISATADGGFVLSGVARDDCSNSIKSRLFLLKVDSSGNIKWSRTYGGAKDDYFYPYVASTKDQGYIILFNNILLKVDSDGNIDWYKAFTGSGFSGSFIQQTGDGGYAILDDNFVGGLARLDSQGNIRWHRLYEIEKLQRLRSFVQAKDGGFLIVGGIERFSPHQKNILIFKVDNSGRTSSPCIQVLPGLPLSERPIQMRQVSLGVNVHDAIKPVEIGGPESIFDSILNETCER